MVVELKYIPSQKGQVYLTTLRTSLQKI